MTKDKLSKSLSWDDFQSLGNPENADEPNNASENEATEFQPDPAIRIYLDKKGRRGKSVTIIKGLGVSEDELLHLSKELKSHCGVGGSVKDGTILLQGDQRSKAVGIFQLKGYTNVKIAGS